MQNKTLLSIAGFDPSSGAGIAADLMVFAAYGNFGTSCITALTVQNTLGVIATHVIATDIIMDTLHNLYADLPPVGIKIGMLGTSSAVCAVAGFLADIRHQTPLTVVLDPVLRSSSGGELLDSQGVLEMRSKLLPLVDWITPNAEELAILVNCPLPRSSSEIASAAADLQHLGRELTVVVTGGHLNPPDDLLLEPNSAPQSFLGQHVATNSTHGTGCAFSSALLCHLVGGERAAEATRAAKAYVAEAMRSAVARGSGAGPLHHLWPLDEGPREREGRH